MKLLRVHIISSQTCGGLLDDLNVILRSPFEDYSSFSSFDPLCLIGANGAGKSQFLQMIAEIFQSVYHTCIPEEERVEGNPELQFEVEYLIHQDENQSLVRVCISRKIKTGKQRPSLLIQRRDESEWIECNLADPETIKLLPEKIVGYTSGDNETLSLPFLISRSGYAEEVGSRALNHSTRDLTIPDTRLMLIDYGTHLEVLVANLLLGNSAQSEALLQDVKLRNLHSFRCVVQLAHNAAPKVGKKGSQRSGKGIQLTSELEIYIDRLKRCATCYDYDDKTETYTFDYWVNEQTKSAFNYFWNSTLELYSSLHKLAMLNDLVLPKKTRERFRKDTKERRFASRLPEPQDEDKVFRFERVSFLSTNSSIVLDYVSLSDGEHQLSQLLGIFCMLSSPNVLFLLDEPESHFNPQWRVKFISKIINLPTNDGDRKTTSNASKQDCLLTTHSPFVPSDMDKDKVFIFRKDEEGRIEINNPDIQTFGATFDRIIGKCFDVAPPLSQRSRDEIKELMESNNPDAIRDGIQRLGDSVEKAFLADRLRQVTNQNRS